MAAPSKMAALLQPTFAGINPRFHAVNEKLQKLEVLQVSQACPDPAGAQPAARLARMDATIHRPARRRTRPRRGEYLLRQLARAGRSGSPLACTHKIAIE